MNIVATESNSDLADLVRVNNLIDDADADTLRRRWQFGKLVLPMRGRGGRLPCGKLEQIVAATGRPASELKRRSLFAQRFDADDLAHAIAQRRSWNQVVHWNRNAELAEQQQRNRGDAQSMQEAHLINAFDSLLHPMLEPIAVERYSLGAKRLIIESLEYAIETLKESSNACTQQRI